MLASSDAISETESFLKSFNRDNNVAVTVAMLNIKIEGKDFPVLAKYFDNIQLFTEDMGLTAAEMGDVRNTVASQGNQMAMLKCFKMWKNHDPPNATYKTLVEIVLNLGQVELATKIVQYMIDKNINGIRQACIN